MTYEIPKAETRLGDFLVAEVRNRRVQEDLTLMILVLLIYENTYNKIQM